MPKRSKSVKITDIKSEKPWLKKVGLFKYAIDSIEQRKRFLIVCEGQTEAFYFSSFPVLAIDIKTVHQGCSKSALVACIPYYTEYENYDEVWCVFDMDFTSGDNSQYKDFDNAIKTAYQSGYKCAYSNDAFELWFVLHYQYIDQEQLRTLYFDILSEWWGVNYEKNGKSRIFSQLIYNKLLTDQRASQERAIKNAEKLLAEQQYKIFHLQNPVTTVHLLVKELNLHLRK